MANTMRRKRSIRQRVKISFLFIVFPLVLFLTLSTMGVLPLAAKRMWGLEHYHGVCKQFHVADYGRTSPRVGYFDFDNGLTVRIIEGNWVDCGLTEEQLSAAEGNICEVTYTKAESFGGAHRLFSITSDGQELISEADMVNEFRRFAKIEIIAISIIVVIGVIIFLLTGQKRGSTKGQNKRQKSRRKRNHNTD